MPKPREAAHIDAEFLACSAGEPVQESLTIFGAIFIADNVSGSHAVTLDF